MMPDNANKKVPNFGTFLLKNIINQTINIASP